MNTTTLSIFALSVLMLLKCPSVHGNDVVDSEIRIRIHVPSADRLMNEKFHNYVVRIENRTQNSIPVLSTLTYMGDGINVPIQLRIQTRADVNSGIPDSLDDWAAITRQAKPSEMMTHPSMLEGGKAVELIMDYAAVGLLPDGESRIACQVGPDQVVYSNWVNIKTLPAEDPANWQIIETNMEVAKSGWAYDFLLSQGQLGKILYGRSTQYKDSIRRICYCPEGEMPVITADRNKSQAVIRFPNHAEKTLYYNALIGYSKSTPWPDDVKAADLSGKFIPVDAPSPLAFPLSLFTNDDTATPAAGVKDHHKSQPLDCRTHSETLDLPKFPTAARTWIGFATACATILVAWFLYLVIRARKHKGHE